jgi:hypothetical protein
MVTLVPLTLRWHGPACRAPGIANPQVPGNVARSLRRAGGILHHTFRSPVAYLRRLSLMKGETQGPLWEGMNHTLTSGHGQRGSFFDRTRGLFLTQSELLSPNGISSPVGWFRPWKSTPTTTTRQLRLSDSSTPGAMVPAPVRGANRCGPTRAEKSSTLPRKIWNKVAWQR